jgi:predicted small secreted protein
MKISMKISMKIKALAICCLPILATTFLSACNTVEGFGKDVKSVGQSMENAAAKKTGN